MENVGDVEGVLMRVFDEVLHELKADGSDDDHVSFLLNHPMLQQPILVPLRPQRLMNSEDIVEAIVKVLQSKTDLPLDGEKTTIYFTRIDKPTGSGGGHLKRRYNTNVSEYLKKKRGIIEINNRDELCCARAIVTAIAKIDNDENYDTIRRGDRGRCTMQRRLAMALMAKAGLASHQGPCGPEEWILLQDALRKEGDYQLKIFCKDSFNGLVYAGPNASKVIRLWHHDHHFDAITSILAFYECSYYCDDCDKAYEKKIEHRRCPVRCSWCFESGQCRASVDGELINCGSCHRYFNNEQCYQNHLKQKGDGRHKASSICDQLKRCGECKREYRTQKGHECGLKRCQTCKVDYHGDDHECFIQPIDKCEHVEDVEGEEEGFVKEIRESNQNECDKEEPKRKKSKKDQRTSYIFFDIEATQDNVVGQNEQGDICRHAPNFVVVDKVCSVCCELPTLGPCDYCKENRQIFKGERCLDQFCEWLFKKSNKGAIALAHNAKAYDSQFVLEYCHRIGIKPDHIICRGLEILYMEVCGVKFKDSLNFLPMALASLPKAFGVEECKKGYVKFSRL